MIITISVILLILIVFVIAYPLYFQKVTFHISSESTSSDFNEQDALLSALSDLEEEFQLGKLSESDYQRLKIHFQRSYLQTKKSDLLTQS